MSLRNFTRKDQLDKKKKNANKVAQMFDRSKARKKMRIYDDDVREGGVGYIFSRRASTDRRGYFLDGISS